MEDENPTYLYMSGSPSCLKNDDEAEHCQKTFSHTQLHRHTWTLKGSHIPVMIKTSVG